MPTGEFEGEILVVDLHLKSPFIKKNSIRDFKKSLESNLLIIASTWPHSPPHTGPLYTPLQSRSQKDTGQL